MLGASLSVLLWLVDKGVRPLFQQAQETPALALAHHLSRQV